MTIAGKKVLVTGASRGIGQALVAEALSRGCPARKSRHRPPPVGAPVAAWPARAASHAPQGAAGSAAARPGERVLGLPADKRRARGTGHHRAPSTVWEILKNAGTGPAPRRDGPGRAGFLRSQAQGILALDFFTAGLLNGATVHVLAVTGHGTRRVRILGATEHPV